MDLHNEGETLSKAAGEEHHHGIYHGVDLNKVNLSSLPKAQREHLLMHEKHHGHENMHAMMLLILLGSMFVAQILLILWRKKSFKTYQNVSMFGKLTFWSDFFSFFFLNFY